MALKISLFLEAGFEKFLYAHIYSVTTEQMSKIHDFSGGMFCHTQLNAST